MNPAHTAILFVLSMSRLSVAAVAQPLGPFHPTGAPEDTSQRAIYQARLPEAPHPKQVSTLTIGVAPSDDATGAKWYQLIGTKVNGESFTVRFLANGNPFSPRPQKDTVIHRYILQEANEPPIEYIDERTGKALIPRFGFVENLLPHADDSAAEMPFERGIYLGHPIVRLGMLKSDGVKVPPSTQKLIFRGDLIIGTSRNFRDDGTGRKNREANYNYVPFTKEDYAEMVAAGVNYFTAKGEQVNWICRRPVFYDGYSPQIAFPEELYRPNFLGLDMFIDEPACILAGKYPPGSPLSTAVEMIHEHIGKETNSTAYQTLLTRDGIGLGSLLLPEPAVPIWETYIETSYYQLEANPYGIVQECRWRIDPNADSQQILLLQRINEEFGVDIPITPENLFLWSYSQMRGAARVFGSKWGMSIYGQAEHSLRLPSMKLAYDLGAEFIWFWTSDHDHHVPYREQLRLAREMSDYARSHPRPSLDKLRQGARTAIVLPYGYSLPTSWQLHTWGTHIYSLNRTSESGRTYKEVLTPAVQEIARCLKNSIPYDVVPAGKDFDPSGYENVVRITERGTAGSLPMVPQLHSLTISPDLNLYVWTDTCNVYVLREGDSAILIDLGDGSVLDHLTEIGVSHVEWVLFTHHHREQCQGVAGLQRWKPQIAAPEAERALFEEPTKFRKAKCTLGDAHTVHGASYVRPPVGPIHLDRTLRDGDIFSWKGRQIRCVDTRGNSPGGMSYLLKVGDRWTAFSGDVVLDGARMHTWFDTEWDYGFAKGLYELIGSISMLQSFRPTHLLPSHGAIIPTPEAQLQEYQRRLRRLAELYVRGYPISTFSAADQDTVSTPTSIPYIWQVTEHLYKFKKRDFWPNFGILIADNGHALVFDCGLIGTDLLEQSLKSMQEQLGLKTIDAVLITHMHGDHFLDVPYLRDKWGTQIWTLKDVADKCEHPERYDYAAMIPAYQAGFDALHIDRAFERGESFEWQEYKFTVDWMPGQTEFGCCIHGVIDGKHVAFTGDNLFGSSSDPSQNGHEAVVARNSAIFEEGYIYGADHLQKLQPDMIVAGHSYVIDRPKGMIERFAAWAREIRDTYQSLSAEKDYRYMFDPYWVRAEPYRVSVRAGQQADVTLHVRNFQPQSQSHRIQACAMQGIGIQPGVLEGSVEPQSTGHFQLRLSAAPDLKPGVYIVAFDVALDGRRYGQWFDMILSVEP